MKHSMMRPPGACAPAVWVIAVLLSTLGCGLSPTNPFDPDTPLEQQAKGALTGRVQLLDGNADRAALQGELAALRVVVLAERGGELKNADGTLLDVRQEVVLDDDSGPHLTFTREGLVPGRYTVRVDGVGSRFLAPPIPTVTLAPGATSDLGALVFVTRDDGGPGVIEGSVQLVGASGGPRQVELYRAGGVAPSLLSARRTDASGAFRFAGLPVGRYAIVSTLEGFTPDYRLDLEVGEQGEARLLHSLSGADALALHPVTAVLLPQVQQVEGVYYTRHDEVPLSVLAFGGVTGMRLSASSSFADDDGGELPFTPYSASATVPLPARQGLISLYGQFEVESAGFTFVSPVFETRVVRDVSAPRVLAAVPPGVTRNADGSYFLTAENLSITLDIDALDEHSAIAGAVVTQPDDGVAPTPDELTFVDVTSAGGVARVNLPVPLVAGEGPRLAFVFVRDRAGNVSEPFEVALIVKTQAVELPLLVNNAADGELRTRYASLSFDEADSDERPVAMQVGLAPLRSSVPVVPYEPTTSVYVEEPHGTVLRFEAKLFDAAGNVARVESETLVLSLTATVAGRLAFEGVPSLRPDHGDALVRLVRSSDEGSLPVAETTTAQSGAFLFGGVPEGQDYRLVVNVAGYERVEQLLPPLLPSASLQLPATPMRLARGGLAGRFLLSDQEQAPDAHGGILVVATLGGLDRQLVLTGVTQPSGEWHIPNVPVTRGVERWRVEGMAQGYARASAGEAEVSEGLMSFVPPSGSAPSTAEPVSLQPISGDFDLCAQTEPCVPLVYTNLDTVRVRLRSSVGVEQVRARARQGFAEGDSEPAFAPYDPLSEPLVDVSGADGVVDVYVQVITDGSPGPVLRASFTRDTVPPDITSLQLEPHPDALDPAFTRASTVRAQLDATPGVGAVAPLGSARLAFASSAPSFPPAGATQCAHGLSCTVPLPDGGSGVVEGIHTLYGFACDLAGNCSTSPAVARVIHDRTPPSALHGAGITATGASTVQHGGTTYTRSPSTRTQLQLGTARTSAGTEVRDLDGQAVPDVVAVRLGLEPLLQGTMVQLVEGALDAGGTRELTTPTLPAGDGAYRVYAQLIDRAGNRTSVEPNTFFYDLVLDTLPPSASFQLAGGAATTTTVNVPLTVSASPLDEPVRIWLATDGGLFESYSERAFPFTGSHGVFTLPAGAPPGGDGVYTVYARLFDAAGNAADRQGTIRLDRTPPTVRSVQCVACAAVDGALYTSASNRQVVLDVDAVDLGGSVPSVRARVGTGVVQTFPYGAPFTLTLPADGLHSITVWALDDAGNESPPYTLAITLDRVAPTAPSALVTRDQARGMNVTSGSTIADAQPRLSFTGSTDAHGGPVRYRVELGTSPALLSPEVSVDIGETRSFVPGGELGDRTWHWRVIARDRAGNTSTSGVFTFIVDRSPPQAPDIAPIPPFVNGTFTASWTAPEPADTASYRVTLLRGAFPGAEVLSMTTSDTSRSLRAGIELVSSLQDGTPHHLRVRAVDAVGNESPTTTASFRYDTAAPCQLSPGSAVARLNNEQGFVGGTQYTSNGAAFVQVSCNGEQPDTMRVNCDGANVAGIAPVAFQDTLVCTLNTATQGIKQVTAAVYDAAGNASQAATRSLFFDDVRPTTPRLAALQAVTGSATLLLPPLALPSSDPGGASASGFAASPYEVRAPAHPAPLEWNGTTQLPVSLLRGDNVIRVRAVDRAGNASDEDIVTVRYDPARPTVTDLVVEPGNGDVLVTWETPDTDVVRFEVLYGPAQGTYTGTNADQGFSPVDMGLSTKVRLTGLPNGTPVYVAVRALDEVGPGPTVAAPVVYPYEAPLIRAGSIAMPGEGYARAVAYADGLAFVAFGCQAATSCAYSGLAAFDLSDPSSPVQVGAFRSTVGVGALALDLAILGDYAYVSDGPQIRVFRISDPTNIRLTSTFLLPDNGHPGPDIATALIARPGQLFVAQESEGLRIFSIGDAGDLTLRGTYNPPCPGTDCLFRGSGRAISLAVQGSYAYVGVAGFPEQSGARAVEVVDVSNPAAPARAGSGALRLRMAWDVEVHGHLLYLAQNGQLRVHDVGGGPVEAIEPPENAVARWTGQPKNVHVAGPYVYVRDDAEIRALSAADRPAGSPELPVVGRVALDPDTQIDRHAICADDGPVVVFPRYRMFCTIDRTAAGRSTMTVAGNQLLLASGPLVVYRVGRPVRTREIAHVVLPTQGNAGSAANGLNLDHKGRYLVQAGRTGLGVLRIDNPAAPLALGAFTDAADHHVLAQEGDTLYLGTRGALQQYRYSAGGGALKLDLNEGEKGGWRIQTLGSVAYGVDKRATALLVRWPYAYVVASDPNAPGHARTLNELRVLNLRTGAVVGSLALADGNGFRDASIAYHRDRLYITRTTGPNVLVVDISDRAASPTLAGTITLPNAAGVAVQGTQLYVGGVAHTRVYDLGTSLVAPPLLGQINIGGETPAVSGDYVYSPNSPAPAIFHVLDPASPQLIATPGSINGFEEGAHVVGKHVFMQDRSELSVVELQ